MRSLANACGMRGQNFEELRERPVLWVCFSDGSAGAVSLLGMFFSNFCQIFCRYRYALIYTTVVRLPCAMGHAGAREVVLCAGGG